MYPKSKIEQSFPFIMLIQILIYIPLVSSFGIIENGLDRPTGLANFAINIVENECKNCKSIMVIHSGQEESCELFFNKLRNNPSMYTIIVDGNGTEISENKTTEFVQLPELIIMFLNTEVIDIEAVIFSVELLEIWNIRGKFLLLSDSGITDDDEEFNEWLQETFESFWNRQALKVLIAIWKTANDLITYTYNPYIHDYKILVEKKDRFSKWFNRIVDDMYGEPIKLYQFDAVLTEAAVRKTLPNGKETWVGPDGMFFSVLAECLNTTLLSHALSDDFEDDMIQDADPNIPFSQYFKLFSDMFDFDLLFNRMQTFSDNTLDHVFLYERNEWHVIVPKTGIIPQYLYMLLLVSGDVWTAILISLLSVILIRKMLGGKKSAPFLDNLVYLLGTAAPHRNHMSSKERIILATWTLGCVVIVTLFQTTLMSTLAVPKYYPNLDTLDELANTDLMVYSPEYTTIQIKKILNEHKFMEHVLNVPRNVTIYGDNVEWIDLYKQKFGLIITREQLYRLHKLDPTLFETNHLMAESPMPNAVSYNMPRNKLYFEEVQRVFGLIQEAGLHLHWRNYDYNLNRNITINAKKSSEDNNQTLTLFHLQSAFMLLIFGLSISLGVFCCEIAWYRIIRKN